MVRVVSETESDRDEGTITCAKQGCNGRPFTTLDFEQGLRSGENTRWHTATIDISIEPQNLESTRQGTEPAAVRTAQLATAALAFDAREATVAGVRAAVLEGRTTCRQVVAAHLARTETLNKHINAIICLDPSALTRADELDAALRAGVPAGALFGVPVLLKDNYDAAGLPTTGGCRALRGAIPLEDAPVVAALRAEGAVVLGKTNLHELALEGLTVSSLGGQTLNPFDASRTPGGSSGGSGAALAMSLAVLATGSDTFNSLRSPAAANSICSVRPTRGLIAKEGIMPNSATQDAAGPMARCVEDLAVMLTVMASACRDGRTPSADYSLGLRQSTLRGARLGVADALFNRDTSDETAPVNEAIDRAVDILRQAGATVVHVEDEVFADTARTLAELDTQASEMRELLDAYLSREALGGDHPRSLQTLLETGDFLVIPRQHEYIRKAMGHSTSSAKFEDVKAGIERLTLAIKAVFDSQKLDALVYPQQRILPVRIGSPMQAHRNGIYAALTGFPVVAVPAGASPPSAAAPRGVPIGMELMGPPFSEAKLLRLAYQLEQMGRLRRTPLAAEEHVEARDMNAVPVITPDVASIPSEYPIGTY